MLCSVIVLNQYISDVMRGESMYDHPCLKKDMAFLEARFEQATRENRAGKSDAAYRSLIRTVPSISTKERPMHEWRPPLVGHWMPYIWR